MSKYFETVNFWLENLLDSVGNYTIESNEKGKYVDIVIKQLELLRPEIVIHRITGDPDKNELIEPTWLTKKFVVLNEIDKEMKRRNTYQGIKYESIPNNN